MTNYASGSFADVSEAEAFLQTNPDVGSIELFLIDPCGVPRGKLLRREELLAVYRHGRPLPSSIMGLTINGEDVDETGLVWDVADADCLARPLAGSLKRIPWRAAPTAQVHVALDPVAGMPAFVADPRGVLARVVEGLKGDGYHPVMAAELEFYLLDAQPGADGRPRPAPLADGSRPHAPQVYGVRELSLMEPFLSALYAAAQALELPVRTAISEYAPGQFELTLEHRADALQAMDEAVRYKRLVKGVAESLRFTACFMAKPFAHLAGNGFHMHVSLADGQGANLFASDETQGNALLRHAIGGLLATIEDGLAIFCPNANSYRRFQSNSYAPLARTWGVNNRTVSMRVPTGPAASRHVEHRIAGADANPYLLAAAVLAGVRDGIRSRTDPGAPVTGNGYAQAGDPVPRDWRRALDLLKGSAWAREAFGAEFLRVFLAIKEAEYRQFMGEVGEQDWRWYQFTA